MPNSETQKIALNASGTSCWKIEGAKATFSCNNLQGEICLENPTVGLAKLLAGDKATLWQAAGANAPSGQATDAYIRANDLVYTLPANEQFPCTTIWYWTVLPLKACEGVQVRLTLSFLTDYLDSSVSFQLSSAPATEPSQADTQNRYLAMGTDGSQCLEVIHPDDVLEGTFKQSDGSELNVSIPFLEKGVICLARVAALLVPANVEPAVVEQAVAEFVNEPLPLTT